MSEVSKGHKVAYWIMTGLLAAGFGIGGVVDLIAPLDLVESFEHLGYPLHLLTLLGIAKLLAVVTILAPGFQRLKEWAYAGLTFDLIGALWSHVLVGDGVDQYGLIFVFLALVFGSYFMRPADRRLPDPVG